MKEGASLRHEWRQYRERTVAGISASIDKFRRFCSSRQDYSGTARVDQSYGSRVTTCHQSSSQSHMVNARTTHRGTNESAERVFKDEWRFPYLSDDCDWGELRQYGSEGGGSWNVRNVRIDLVVARTMALHQPERLPLHGLSSKTPSSTAKPRPHGPTNVKAGLLMELGKRFITFFIFMATVVI
jgi:hypothetical protein